MSAIIQSAAPQTKARFAIVRDADWRDMWWSMTDGDGPIDMTLYGRQYHYIIRPQYDHATLIAEYFSVSSRSVAGIFVDPDDADKVPEIFVPQATVAAVFPAGLYDHFLLLEETTIGYVTEMFRGKLEVHPGNRG